MPKTIAFVLANDVASFPSASGAQSPALINPIPVLRPKYIPSMFSFAFSISICGVDLSKQIDVKMIIEDPERRVVQEAVRIDIPPQPVIENGSLPKEYRGFTLNVGVRNFPLEKEGVYHLIPYIDGVAMEPQDIPVFIQAAEEKQG